jgi:hypothetical protein
VLVPFTPLSPSRREAGLRQAARVAAWVAAALLGFAALQAEPVRWTLLLAAAVAVVGGVAAGRGRPVSRVEVGIDRRGRVVARRASGPDEPAGHRLRCIFAAPWLITLRQDTMFIPVWPDSVPGNTFRRLWVHIRWSAHRGGADLPAGPQPYPSQ